MSFADNMRSIYNEAIEKEKSEFLDMVQHCIKMDIICGNNSTTLKNITTDQSDIIDKNSGQYVNMKIHTSDKNEDNKVTKTFTWEGNNYTNNSEMYFYEADLEFNKIKGQIIAAAKLAQSSIKFKFNYTPMVLDMVVDMLNDNGFKVVIYNNDLSIYWGLECTDKSYTFYENIYTITENNKEVFKKELEMKKFIEDKINSQAIYGTFTFTSSQLPNCNSKYFDLVTKTATLKILSHYKFNFTYNADNTESIVVCWNNLNDNNMKLPHFTREIISKYRKYSEQNHSSGVSIQKEYNDIKEAIKCRAENARDNLVITNGKILNNYRLIFKDILQMLKDDGFTFTMDENNNCVIRF